ncbi:hypothetical protein RHMOL_Rhmol09G0160300 [Rhododendron molle]|uniref:Uncharacterized protein n=1 Tax=Rhododendron molle TaxID=49168 RepID=A0ACC0MDZ8_RHOML|nr:hypothetical protein RHMOL_Rhmol09G0160300 [Rhododendron molle]
MVEVAKKPLVVRKFGVSALLWICEELEPTVLNLIRGCLYEEIRAALSSGLSLHLSHLLSLLISTVQIDYIRKTEDYQLMLQVAGMLMQKFILPLSMQKAEDQSFEVVDKLLQLMLCILDGLHLADNVSVISIVSVQWAPVFKSSKSSALYDIIETSKEEVIPLLLIFCERMQVQVQSPSFLDGASGEQVSRICSHLQDAIAYWIEIIYEIVQGDSSVIQLQESELALVWGIISCYPYLKVIQADSSLLLDFVDALDQLLVIDAGFHRHTWQSLIGAALSSYNKLCSSNFIRDEEVSKYLRLAARYRSSSHILSAVADFLDMMNGSALQEETSTVRLHPELKAEKAAESLCIFAENLCQSDKLIRISTLRILSHYQLLNYEHSPKEEPTQENMKSEVSHTCFADDRGCNVLRLLLSIEDTPVSVTTSRRVILLISRIQMGLSSARIAETYLPSVLYGIIGIFHNRFSSLWDPALDCMAVVISKYFDVTWDGFVQYLEQCQSNFLASNGQSDRSNSVSTCNSSGLVERFHFFLSPASDNNPCVTVLSLLIRSLQKVPGVIESHSQQLVPLFLKFMGYNLDDLVSGGTFKAQVFKGKEWKNILKEWLTLLKSLRHPKSFYRSQFLKDVLQYRLLDENDAEIQMMVLDCLLNWKDDFLVPYDQHLKCLISSRSLRKELTTWSLSKESNLIEESHRTYLVPFVIRILIPKVRKLKTLASRKTSTAVKQFKELRSLCLKIISWVLNKYDDQEFGCEFWNLFFDSVKPLVNGFKQECASSAKPSSLFSCFLSMSGSYKLVWLLHREKSIVSDIFSILTVPTASEAILSCLLKFVENLLNLDSDLDHEDNPVKRTLLPNLDALICGLHCLFLCNKAAKRKLVKCPGERELSIFRLLSKYIKDLSSASKFVDIMLLLLTKGVQDCGVCVEALNVIRQMIPVVGSESTTKILSAVSPLLASVSLDVRMSVCDLLDALAGTDSSLVTVAELVRELNSTFAMEMGGLDYDGIINAYEKINKDFFYTVREKHALLILSHAVHDLSSEELVLRQSGFKLVLSFVEFSAEILDREMKSDDQSWSESCIQRTINKFLLKHMGDAMNKEASIRKVWIDLLREMVLKLPNVPSLTSLRALCGEDAEQDFFKNIMHLQKHRRARALSRFIKFINSVNLSEVISNKVLVPLFLNMVFELQNGKDENVRSACLEALACISGNMEWKSYYAFLMRCFREMTLKSVKEKVLLRLICSVLDHFHFVDTHSGQEANDCVVEASKAGTRGLTSTTVLRRCTSSGEVSKIQACLQKNVCPKIQKLLTSDSDNVNVHISLVALKLLKLLPGDVMELQLPSIIHRISNFLKNRLESIRDEARAALAACLKELGLEYLQFIVKVLRATLKRGYELHLLGYTLNFILSKFVVNPIGGKLDYCLEELLSVVENDILGDVSEEKDVEKIASKMKETRKLKSFETLKLIAQNTTFKTCAAKLLLRVTTRLQKHLTPKVKSKLESMLNNIAAGIECNPSVNQSDLFVFLYTLIEDGITYETGRNKSSSVLNTSKQSGDETISKIITSGGLIDSSQSSHLVRVFALGLLHNRLKNIELHKKDEQQLEMLDPFVRLLTECLTSKYDGIISAALRCLAPLVGLHLPALKSQANKIKTSLLVIAHGSINSSPMMQSCLRYAHSAGRETVLEMLHAFVIKFPKRILDEHFNTIFMHLVLCLANDNDNKVRSMTGTAIKLLIGRVSKNLIGPVKGKERDAGLSFLELSLPWYSGGEEHVQSVAAQVLGLLVQVTGEDLKEEYINHVLPVMRSIFQSAVDVLKNRQLGVSAEATDCSWKGAYYSLILLEKILHHFHGLCLAGHLEDMWETICELLLHPHVWLHGVLNRLVAFYFASVDQADGANHEKSLGTFFLMTPSRLFLVAVSLCCQLKALLIDDAASTLITQNLASTICALHSFFVPNKSVGGNSIWSTLEHHEQSRFLEAFQVLDSLKGRSMFASLTSGYDNQIAEENGDRHSLLVYYLLKRMGKIALQMEAVQMKIVFNVFELISPKIINPVSSQIGDVQGYAYQQLLPLYKVCEGYAGKVISDDVKQLAQEALECIRDTLGMNNFAPIYSRIRKNLKEKRDRRKQREKLMPVVNPMRNAKRKRRIADKNRANKKRKVVTMKMIKWRR